jgi:pimeloyl-ACP methyl ester carboxylesterase
VLLLHGFQNTGDTFQFLVDAMHQEWPLAALDFRGFGRSAWAASSYFFPDYLADLDELLDQLSPQAPACLVGHSMGGNVACQYAGVRPERVRCVVDLEGIGINRTVPDDAPDLLRKWLRQIKKTPPAKHYDSFEQLASVIEFRYPRFTAPRAHYLARIWAAQRSDGRIQLLGDPRHAWPNPVLYRREESEAIWRRIEAPVLLLLGAKSEFAARLGEDGTDSAFHALFRRLDIARIEDAGHMLHIENPDTVASLTENFLSVHR